KEVVYSHCEGMYSSEFKHGPLSIVTEGYPILFLGTREDSGMLISHINEVTCRNGKAIAISPASPEIRKNASQMLELPEVPYYMVPMAATVVIQLLAYFMSVRRGIDPDFPRNISKTLTVD
ncbi:MAG TPA: glutamine--fructose-6-phosphate transaminase (isomerizing), partial [Firmicutes bacterium]|nr:glutamine--fructose-6-phosphate transaminase (isomerizing) [Bacillota bacterium]